MLVITGRCGLTAKAVPLASNSAKTTMGASLLRKLCRSFIRFSFRLPAGVSAGR
jgi:hypothetical protein